MSYDSIICLGVMFAVVMASFLLDGLSCSVVSSSSFAILFGIVCGLFIALANNLSLERHLHFHNSVFFQLLLPPIIYEAGFSMKRQAFFSNVGAILTTAVLGTLIATCATGALLTTAVRLEWVRSSLSWVETFLFGALISAVDPVATLACFNKLNAPPLLFNMLFGESVLNDAVSIVLFQILKGWSATKPFAPIELLYVARNMLGVFAGSLGVSAFITLFGAFLLKRKCLARLRLFPAYEITLCLIFSLMTYFVADALELSGIVALFFSGAMTAHYQFHTISCAAQHAFTHLLHTAAFVSESFVYVFMGISVVLVFAGQQEIAGSMELKDIDWAFIGLTIVACFVARFLNTFPLLCLSNCWRVPGDKIPIKYMFVIWFAGLRGGIAFALAKTWDYVGPHGSNRHLIISTTLIVVLFTTVVIGGITGPLLTCLNLTDKQDDYSASDKSTDSNLSPPEGSINTTPLQAVPKHPSPSTLQKRRSSHYLVNGTPGEQVANETSNQSSYPIGSVLTPRPQFRSNSSIQQDFDSPVSIQSAHPDGTIGNSVLKRGWSFFDNNYLQPMFGGSAESFRPQEHDGEEFIKNKV